MKKDNSLFANEWQAQRNANIVAEYNKLSAKEKQEAINYNKQSKKKK